MYLVDLLSGVLGISRRLPRKSVSCEVSLVSKKRNVENLRINGTVNNSLADVYSCPGLVIKYMLTFTNTEDITNENVWYPSLWNLEINKSKISLTVWKYKYPLTWKYFTDKISLTLWKYKHSLCTFAFLWNCNNSLTDVYSCSGLVEKYLLTFTTTEEITNEKFWYMKFRNKLKISLTYMKI